MPSEGEGVISVSSTGPSTRKAYYSDYGNGYIDVAAPGGDVYDTPTDELARTQLDLAAYPESLAIANGELNPDGTPNVPNVVQSCNDSGVCAYYQYIQGTSMASPHAAGVAALIVSRYGFGDWQHGGKFLFPDAVEWIMKATATKTPCPTPPEFTYTRIRPTDPPTTVVTTHTCEGTADGNGFYGSGIINATRAVGK